MRIAIFSDYYLPHIGGVETSVYHQQRALQAAGHEVWVISPKMRGAGHIDDDKENVIRLSGRFSFVYDGMDLYLWPRRRHYQIIDHLKPDIIHVQSQESLALFAAKYAKSRNLPLIYTAHTFLTPQTAMLVPFPRLISTMAVIRQHIFLGRISPRLKVRAKDNLFGIPCKSYTDRTILKAWMRYASLADIVIAPSQRMVDFVDHYVSGSPKYMIPNPFHSQALQAAPVQPVHQPVKVITSFVLRPEKRPQVLIEACRLLGSEERAKLKVDMYGGGLWLKKMRKLVSKYKLEDTITLHGPVHTDKLHQAKLDSDIMVLASLGFDNQPMVFLEALSAGCAIMYCDEYLKEGTQASNSVLVEPSAEGFAEGLRKIINDPERLNAMKKASKREAKNFDYPAFAAKYNQMLKEQNLLPKN